MESLLRKAAKFMQSRRKNKRWRNLVTCLAAVVVFGTTYALILPAITIDDETAQKEPGLVLIQDGDAAQEEKQETSLTDETYPEDSEDVIDQNDVAIGATEEEQESDSLNEFPADLQMIDISALDAETKTLSFEGADYKVTVTYDESAGIPEGASLQAEEIEAESEEYASLLATASQTLEEQDTYIHKARFFDISILDGENEIEPASAVDVQIALAAEENIDTDALIVTHEDELISTVDTTEEEDGTVTLAFETESFSNYGVISPGGSKTISVGDTMTLSGTDLGYGTVSWSVSPSGIVTLVESSNTATVTGASDGTVTVTHEYYTKKNQKSTKEEYFTITVTESADDDETTKEAVNSGSGYTVTVKGNTKVLTDDVTLHVEDYAAGTASDYKDYYDALVADLKTAASKDTITKSDFDFLQMYHIYLTKTGVEGEYVPEGNVNLQVTITYDTAPANWDKVNWVGHYKKSNGTVNKQDISDGSNSSAGVKQIKVSGKSITFHIQSFSVFPVAALASDEGDDNSGGGSTGGGNESQDATFIEAPMPEGGNSWQIVSPGGTYNYNDVRLTKTVSPTENENEFKVHLSVDKKQKSVSDILGNAKWDMATTGKYKESDVGKIFSGKINGSEIILTTDPNESAGKDAYGTWNFYYENKLIASIPLWGEDKAPSNATPYIDFGTSFLVIGSQVSPGEGETFNVNLSDEAMQYLTSTSVAEPPMLKVVTDRMGSNITYLSYDPEKTNGTVSVTDNLLSWMITEKENVETTTETSESGTITITETWYLNVAELEYTVKLTPTVSCSAYDSSGNLIASEANGSVCKVNEVATLTYRISGETTDTTSDFPVPTVKGLLYELKLRKVDSQTNDSLLGAVFGLYGDSNCEDESKITEATSDVEGIVDFGNLQCGTYYLKEISAPSGYKIDDETVKTYELCYTSNRDILIGQGKDQAEEALYDISNSEEQYFKNTVSSKPVILKKVTEDGTTPLAGAEFKLYYKETEYGEYGDVTNALLGESGEDGIFSEKNLKLQNGYYRLEEIKAPGGYNKLADAITFTVDANGVSATGEHVKEVDAQTDDDGVTTYTISVTNSTGYKLPDTGGSGTIWFTFGGLAILAGCLMAGFRMRRKRERRSY